MFPASRTELGLGKIPAFDVMGNVLPVSGLKEYSVRIAYLDCASGISGDMTVAALIDAGVDADAIRAGIESLGLPGVSLHIEEVMRGGYRS